MPRYSVCLSPTVGDYDLGVNGKRLEGSRTARLQYSTDGPVRGPALLGWPVADWEGTGCRLCRAASVAAASLIIHCRHRAAVEENYYSPITLCIADRLIIDFSAWVKRILRLTLFPCSSWAPPASRRSKRMCGYSPRTAIDRTASVLPYYYLPFCDQGFRRKQAHTRPCTCSCATRHAESRARSLALGPREPYKALGLSLTSSTPTSSTGCCFLRIRHPRQPLHFRRLQHQPYHPPEYPSSLRNLRRS